jgi:hypothetical protein
VGPPADADLWRARLFAILTEHYTVGIQDRLAESIALFARQFGLRHLEAEPVRVNPERPPEFELDAETYGLICDGNWLDVEIYQHFRQAFELAGTQESADEAGVGRRPGYVVKGSNPTVAGVEGLELRVKSLEDQLHAQEIVSQVRLSVMEHRLSRVNTPQVNLFVPVKKSRGKAMSSDAEQIAEGVERAPEKARGG